MKNENKKNDQNNNLATFEVGQTYQMRSVGDYNCVWSFTVVKRTAKTITLEGDTEQPGTISRRVYEFQGVEQVRPFGSYSMCPILGADKVAGEAPAAPAAPATPVNDSRAADAEAVLALLARLHAGQNFQNN